MCLRVTGPLKCTLLSVAESRTSPLFVRTVVQQRRRYRGPAIPGIRQGWRPPCPMARGGQRPTVEPAFCAPQQKPPELLNLKSLPSSITRFLYLREVEGLLGQHVGRDEEALAVNCVVRSRVRKQPPVAMLRRSRAQPPRRSRCGNHWCPPSALGGRAPSPCAAAKPAWLCWVVNAFMCTCVQPPQESKHSLTALPGQRSTANPRRARALLAIKECQTSQQLHSANSAFNQAGPSALRSLS